MSILNTLLLSSTLAAAVGSALISGLFFVFSISVMGAFAELPASHGIDAMQRINRKIINPIFLLAFIGTALACVVVVVTSLWQQQGSFGLAIVGALCYLVGGLLATMLFNVPMNNALDAIEPTAPESAAAWHRYLSRWTRWNHIRTVASLLGSILMVAALCL